MSERAFILRICDENGWRSRFVSIVMPDRLVEAEARERAGLSSIHGSVIRDFWREVHVVMKVRFGLTDETTLLAPEEFFS